MRRHLQALALLIVLCLFFLPGCGEGVDLTPVDMQDLLTKQIPSHKGKVVVVDVWASFCPPCRKEFPKLVRMHHDYADQGLVCISLSIDESRDQAKALSFLRDKNARFTNYRLEEGFDGVGKQWGINIIPAVVVFDRQGQLEKVFRFTDAANDKGFTYSDVESLVKKLL